MPVNNFNKNAAQVLLGDEDLDAQAKRGYAVAQPTTVTGKPLNFGDITNLKKAPDYVVKEGERLRAEADAANKLRGIPSAGALKASGLSPDEVLSGAAGASGTAEVTASPLASQYLNRATAGINAIFGGATGQGRPDLSQLLPSELTAYQSLARTTGSLPTAEAAAQYESLLPSEKDKLTSTINIAKGSTPDLRGTGLSHTAIAGALRLAKEQGTE